MKLCMKHQIPKPFIFLFKIWVDLDLFYGKVKFCNLGFYMEKCDDDGYLKKVVLNDLTSLPNTSLVT